MQLSYFVVSQLSIEPSVSVSQRPFPQDSVLGIFQGNTASLLCLNGNFFGKHLTFGT